jgi:transposase-like protein
MTTYGSTTQCPNCSADHVIRVGEIKDQRRVEFTCASCGAAVVLENETRQPAVYKKGRWDK